MSFKILNSIVLLGHSYNIITAYNKQCATSQEDDSAPSNNVNSPSNGLKRSASFTNKASSETDRCTETSQHRTAEDTNYDIMRNASQVFFANSYSDLTMIPNNTVIEASHHEYAPHISTTSTESENIVDRSVKSSKESSEHDSVFQSTASNDGSYDTCSTAASSELCDVSHDESHDSAKMDSSLLLRRRKHPENHCSINVKISSIPLPETIGIPERECLKESENCDLQE